MVNERENAATLEKNVAPLFIERILEGIDIGIIALDREWRYTFANEYALKVLQKRREELIGRVIWDILPQTAGTPLETGFRKAMDERAPVSFEAFYSIRNLWVNTHAYPVENGIAVRFIDITARKQVEAALRRNEKNLAEAQRVGRIGSWEWDILTGKERWSAEQYAIFGVDPSTFVPSVDSFIRLIHPDDRGRIDRIMRQASFSAAPIEYDFRIVMPDGAIRVIHSIAEVIERDENGQPRYMLGINQDVTDRRRAEEALQASEEKYRTLVETSPDGVTYTDMEARIIYANAKTAQMHGYVPDELIGVNVFSLIDPADRDRVTGNLERTVLTGTAVNIEYTLLRKDGSCFPAELSARAVKDKDGKPLGFVGITRDITERKKAQEEAERGKATLDALMRYIPEQILIVNKEQGILYVSEYSEKISGYPARDLRDLSFEARLKKVPFYHSDGVTPARAEELPSTRVLKTGGSVVNEEWKVKTATGAFIDISIIAGPMKDSQGNVIGAITTWHDITASRKAEDTLRRNEYELRTLVDNSPDLIFRLDQQLRYVYVNPAYERITGLAKDRLIGRTNDQLDMPRQMVDLWQSAVQPVLEGGRENQVEFELPGLFGKRYFSARLIPEFEKTGLVETVLVIARDITERKHAEEQIRYISFHDEVTGLFNRAFFEEEIRRVDTERHLPVSIIMGDVNNLKLSNDVFGHDEGDRLLKAIAGSIRKACRQSDIVARWGGDEFAVILPGTDLAAADETCTRINQIARECTDTIIRPTIAVGVAVKERRDQNMYQVIRQAEQRMYAYKLAHAKENEDGTYACLLERTRERIKDYPSHIERCRELAERFGRELGLSEDQMNDLRLLAELHDVGEAVVPPTILSKPGPLNSDEWSIVKKHPEAGFRIVKSFVDTVRIAEAVFSHCEYWDGSGYPRGIKGKDIPYLARVFLVIDVFDVITHPRPYAATLTSEEAAEELRRSAGKQFDPALVDRFITRVL